MFFHLILAEGKSLDGLIHAVELFMGTTALPALAGLAVLFWTRRRPSAARIAFFLGLSTVLLAGFLCGLVYWNDAVPEWYKVPVGSLLAGLVVCALAWLPAFRRRPIP